MTTVRRAFTVEAPALLVWTALRDAGALERSAGFSVDARLEGHAWDTAFSGGAAVRAILAAFDENLRRLAQAIGRAALDHNASFHVSSDGLTRSRVVWTSDILPDAAALPIGAAIEGSAAVLKRVLEGAVM